MTGGVVQGILAEAAAETGLDDFGDEWFLAPLEAWAADLDQPGLSDFGRRFRAESLCAMSAVACG